MLLLVLLREDLFLHLNTGFIAVNIFVQCQYSNEINSVLVLLKLFMDTQFFNQYLAAVNHTLINLPAT